MHLWWGVVAQRLEPRVETWASSFTPTFPVSVGRDIMSRLSLQSCVNARGSKISHTGGKCVTCRGLHILA